MQPRMGLRKAACASIPSTHEVVCKEGRYRAQNVPEGVYWILETKALQGTAHRQDQPGSPR